MFVLFVSQDIHVTFFAENENIRQQIAGLCFRRIDWVQMREMMSDVTAVHRYYYGHYLFKQYLRF